MTSAPSFVRPAETDEDKLDVIRGKLQEFRDLELEAENVKSKGSEIQQKINTLRAKTLPDLFQEAVVDHIGLPADGNLPAYDADLVPYYKANIPAKNAVRAFAWLKKNKHEDMIRVTISVSLGKGEMKKAEALEKAIQKLELDYDKKLAVPWQTLTAFVREQIEKHNKTPPLALLGATVGNIVKLKKRK